MTAVIAELEIPSDRTAMGDTLTRFDEIGFDVRAIVAHDDLVPSFVRIPAALHPTQVGVRRRSLGRFPRS